MDIIIIVSATSICSIGQVALNELLDSSCGHVTEGNFWEVPTVRAFNLRAH